MVMEWLRLCGVGCNECIQIILTCMVRSFMIVTVQPVLPAVRMLAHFVVHHCKCSAGQHFVTCCDNLAQESSYTSLRTYLSCTCTPVDCKGHSKRPIQQGASAPMGMAIYWLQVLIRHTGHDS